MTVADERMHVVVSYRNARAYIARTVSSLKGQTWRNLSVVVVDDASTDGTAEVLRDVVGDDPRFRWRVLDHRAWPAKARKLALDSLVAKPEEIVVVLDGDDWLASPDALQIIHRLHHERRLLAAYGNYVTTDGEVGSWGRDYPLAAKLTGTLREVGWLAAPPRSFRHGLWSHVDPHALKDRHGKYFRFAADLALFLPILELSGMRTAFFERPLYVYNRDTPSNEDKVDAAAQRQAALEILQQPAHPPLPPAEQARLLG